MSCILVNRLRAAFGDPKSVDPAATAGEYIRVCRGISDDVQEAAATMLINAQKFRAWPTVGEAAAAIRQANSNPNRNKVMPPNLDNFGTWWQDKLDRVRLANSDDQLRAVFAEVEPYAASDMIQRWRWDELLHQCRHNRQSASKIGIATPHNVANAPHFDRPKYLDEGRQEPKTPESIERVDALRKQFLATPIGIKTMDEPDPEDYVSSTAWANEIPYSPVMDQLQRSSRNTHLHTRPMTDKEREAYRLSQRIIGEGDSEDDAA